MKRVLHCITSFFLYILERHYSIYTFLEYKRYGAVKTYVTLNLNNTLPFPKRGEATQKLVYLFQAGGQHHPFSSIVTSISKIGGPTSLPPTDSLAKRLTSWRAHTKRPP
jgi:hypothetical protein